MKRHAILALALLVAACAPPAPPTVAPVTSSSVAPTRRPAPEALLALDPGGAVRVSASCWDQDPAGCPWSVGVNVAYPGDGTRLRLRVVGATPGHFAVSWQPAGGPSSPGPSGEASPDGALSSPLSPGPLPAHLDGEAVILDGLPPLPASLRFEVSWSEPGGPDRTAVFFFRLRAP